MSDATSSFESLNFDWGETSLFVEDLWEVNERLTISSGLRWDQVNFGQLSVRVPGPDASYGSSSTTSPPAEDHISPRLALAYDAREGTVLRASYQHGYRYPDAIYHAWKPIWDSVVAGAGLSVESESMDSFEINLDQELPEHDMRVGVNAYYNLHHDTLFFQHFSGARIEQQGMGAYNRGKQRLWGAWKKGKDWKDAQSLQAPRFSADSSRFFAAANDGNRWYIISVDKRGEKKLDKGHAFITDFAMHPNGKEAAVVHLDADGNGFGGAPGGPGGMLPGMKSLITWGKKTYGAKFDNVASPVFDTKGRHLAYKIMRAGRMGIAIDEGKKVQTEHDYVGRPIFDPKGKRVAYIANKGAQIDAYSIMQSWADTVDRGGRDRVLQHDLSGRKQRESAEHARIAHLCRSPDGKSLAYAARDDGKWRIHAGEQVSAAYDEIGPPQWDEKGQHIVFGARSEREIWWRVMELK